MKGLTALFSLALVGLAQCLSLTDTITWGGDNSRSGYFTTHNMDPAVVGSTQFGQIFRTQLPGVYVGQAEQIFSQPLVYTTPTDGKQYVYFATTQNNLYKLDAKTGEIVAKRNLHIPFLTADLDGCVDINPCIGVTGTGVIDPATDTLYLIAKTYIDQDAGQVAQGRPAGRHYIHAINVNDLRERPNFPVNLEGQLARNNPTRMFTGGIHHQRTALLLTGQYVYAGFASHCVQYNFTGWIMGWDKSSGKIVERWATQGDGVPNDVKGGGVWMSGGGLASDDAGSMFFATGNGYASQLSTIPVSGFQPPTSMEEAACHMKINTDGTLNLIDFFMPYEKQELDGGDKDLGTSPLELLPSQFSCGDIKRIGVVTGKSGKTYWLNLDNLGGYRNGPNNKDKVIQVFQNENSVYAGAGVYPLEGGYIYINVIQYPTHVFKFSCTNGVPSFTKVADSPTNNAYILGVSHGTTTSLNGQEGTGLLWVTDVQNTNFKIYNAVPKDNRLTLVNSFQVTGITKFTRPVFGDGMVYFGTTLGYVYGFGSSNKSPLDCSSPIDFGNLDVAQISSDTTITCTATSDVSISGIKLADGTNYAISGIPTVPLTLTKGKTFTMKATFTPKIVGRLAGDILVDTTTADTSYSTTSHIRLTGMGQSTSPLLSISPQTVTFTTAITGQDPDPETVLLNNNGQTLLSLTSVQYSTTSASGPFQNWTGSGALQVGKFTITNIPSSVSPGKSIAISIKFDSSTIGTFNGFVKFNSNGGSGVLALTASAGAAPVSLLEFQTPDGTGWVPYEAGVPFKFGDVTENTYRSLKFRVTNNAPTGGVKLSLTVSKPPFGVAGIIRAANQVDLAEGTSLAPGQSATAVLTCTVPKSQWNVDTYNGTAQWTMNTNEPGFDKQFIQFFCNAVAEQAPPLLSGGQGKYRYVGCFQENNPGRQLSTQIYSNAQNTIAQCIAACAARGFIFCGTQYHSECWGGNKIPKLKVDGKNCNYECSASVNQICGGNGVGSGAGGAYISLFADSQQWDGKLNGDATQGIAPQSPTVNPGVYGYSSLGCYTEGTSGRALSSGQANDLQTVAGCLKACAAGNFLYGGVEYGGECYCGNSFAAGAGPTLSTDCGMTCNGNDTEFCGGPSRLNMYKFGVLTSTSSSSSSTSTLTSTSSSISSSSAISSTSSSISVSTSTSLVASSTTSFLFSNSSTSTPSSSATLSSTTSSTAVTSSSTTSISGSATSAPSSTASSSSSTSSTSLSQSIDLQGITVSVSSTSTISGSINVPTSSHSSTSSATIIQSTSGSSSSVGTTSGSISSSSTTSTTSSAKATPTGPQIDQQISPSWDFQGCWTEADGIRALHLKSYARDDMTLDSCAAFCEGYTYFGTEYGRECYCGNTLNKGSVKADNQKDCSFLCPGNNFQYCGAGNRLQLYKKGSLTPADVVSSSSTSSTSSSSSSTSSNMSATSSISTTSSSGSTASSTTTTVSSSNTQSISSTSSQGTSTSTPSSLSSSSSTSTSTSQSGTTFSSTSNPQSTSLSATATSSTQSTSSTTTSPKSTASPTTSVWPGSQGFVYYSCVSEPANARLLPDQIYNDGNGMTIDICLQKCTKFKWAGVEYGRECWCGNTLTLKGNQGSSGKNVSDSECNFKCPGDQYVWCGAGSRMSLYVNSASSLPAQIIT